MVRGRVGKPTAEAQRLLAEAAEAYAKHQDGFYQAEAQTGHTVNIMAAQRSANRRWGREPQPAGDETRPPNETG